MATDPKEIQLDNEQRNLLAELSEKTGKPWPELLAEAIGSVRSAANHQPAALEEESVFDALSRDGLIGCMKGGPSDMSTSSKYMEGFGESDR